MDYAFEPASKLHSTSINYQTCQTCFPRKPYNEKLICLGGKLMPQLCLKVSSWENFSCRELPAYSWGSSLARPGGWFYCLDLDTLLASTKLGTLALSSVPSSALPIPFPLNRHLWGSKRSAYQSYSQKKGKELVRVWWNLSQGPMGYLMLPHKQYKKIILSLLFNRPLVEVLWGRGVEGGWEVGRWARKISRMWTAMR